MDYYIDAFVNAFDFVGRATRKEYWMFLLLNFIIGVVIGVMIAFTRSKTLSFVPMVYQMIVFVPHLSLGFRRMHDVNKPGWFFLIPFYNLYLLLQPSHK